MKKGILVLAISSLMFLGCDKESEDIPQACPENAAITAINQRNFILGFSTWSFGPDLEDKSQTYQFIQSWADIYSEQIDNKIPWNALINDSPLPAEFVNDIDDRISRKINGHQLLLSVSLLNTDRSDLLEDYDGNTPNYTSLNDEFIENAYFKYLDYLVSKLNPDYLVIAMEVNELKKNSETKWAEYNY